MRHYEIFTRPEAYIGRLSGLVTVPEGHDPAKEKLPVILFLHGAGEAGDGSARSPERVRVHGVPKYFCENAAFGGLRVITVSPQCPAGLIWDQITLQLMDFLDAALERFGGDPAMISVTGLSMGGFGTWNLLSTYPERFWRAAPICGGIEDEKQKFPRSLKGVPVRAFHAVDDPVVPIELDIAAVRQAIGAGADISFTTYCGLGHDCWTHTYEETDLIDGLVKG